MPESVRFPGPYLAIALLLAVTGPANAALAPAPYPTMAPIARYLSASSAAEIALAKSAAPPSIATAAEVRAFGPHGYDVAVKGTNGFVCLVERGWASPTDDPEFWNPKIRAPICFNAPAARSVIPEYLLRTKLVLSGATKAAVLARLRAGVASKVIGPPEPGSMCYMTSKQGYLNDGAGGPWHPHVMIFEPAAFTPPAWGANQHDSLVFALTDPIEPITTFLVPVPKWSDGTIAPQRHSHH